MRNEYGLTPREQAYLGTEALVGNYIKAVEADAIDDIFSSRFKKDYLKQLKKIANKMARTIGADENFVV